VTLPARTVVEKSIKLERVDDYRWRIPQTGGMRVPGMIYADRELLKDLSTDESPKQVMNVAHLPGIVKYSLAMPDMHWGYGFPIGGVAATDVETGVISPGGVGYDINCGCRLVRSDLALSDVQGRVGGLVRALFNNIPSGVGSTGAIKLSAGEERRVLTQGARWAVSNGYGDAEDLERTEEGGAMEGADPDAVSDHAITRGKQQIGTLGGGNHFLEVDVIDEIFDERIANVFGLAVGFVAVLIHSGSRGLGYQVCDDHLRGMGKAVQKYKIELPDRQLASAPVTSPEGEAYFAAMACAANYAWANRQCLMHWTRETFQKTLGASPASLNMRLVYDVCHNIAKKETHLVDGKARRLCVHRKGATRAFPAGHRDVPECYRSVGQPVLIPGDMGTGSYVLVGTERAMQETFGSTCHGAGRVRSRAESKRVTDSAAVLRQLEEKGILVMATGKKTIAEEAPEAYKDIDHVVNVVHEAGISKRVARLRPLCVIKG
jgi:tRNA-splicing ligase RtcB (3'-phosphate/5'-hydroxy nucleic acid ligase)